MEIMRIITFVIEKYKKHAESPENRKVGFEFAFLRFMMAVPVSDGN